MSQLRLPLKDHLCDPVDEAALHRIAEEIDSRSLGRKRRGFLPLVLIGATAAAAVIVVTTAHRHHDAGPLLLADGRDLVTVDSGGASSEIALSDGSHIRLLPGARMEPLESTGATFSAIVAQGRADFDVRPGGPRHWTIECGLATVEVVGTEFSCERGSGRLRVEVRRGVVLVRGERVPERARRLSAGESLDIREETDRSMVMAGNILDPAALRERANSQEAVASDATVEMANREDSQPRAHGSVARPWRDLARRGRHEDAYATLGPEGLRRESKRLGVNDLLALADVARLSGHPAEAVMPLDRILGDFANDAQAPLAAFALGRLEMDSLGHAQAAASAFRKALALGIPRSLREDVRARLVEAYARSGDGRAAQRAADAYLAEFPKGRHVQAIQGWLRLR
jgi:transmembrane sensor